MAVNFLLKRSGTASKRPNPSSMSFGELALNYDDTTGGVFYKSSSGVAVKVGPVQVSALAPNSAPAGSLGNSRGELWYDSANNLLKTYDGTTFVNPVPNGSTTVVGIVLLEDATSSSSTTTAATPNSVRNAYNLAGAALPKSGGTMTGVITFAFGQTFPVSGIQSATTTQVGVVQLNDTLTSSSVTEALTANQGRVLQDQVDALVISNNLTLAGTFDASSGLMLTTTSSGVLVGFAVGSPLPSPSAGNLDYFVIVTTPGTFSPPGGGGPYSASQGDWFLSSGTVWQFLNVGKDLPIATTGTQGIVQLATDTQTIAGTSSTLAVTPAGVAATSIPKNTVSAKGDIILGTGLSTVTALPVGTNGYTLMADSACTGGVKWTASACTVVTTPITNSGTAVQPIIGISPASTSACGAVQLYDGTNSTSTSLALTAAQGKSLQDQINSISTSSNTILAGTFDASTGLVDSVTTQGASAGFVSGSALPSASAGNADYYVIVDVAGSNGPAGSPPYVVGDWFLSNGTSWQYLSLGFQAAYATTTSDGVVSLATNAEVQAGSNSTKVVVPSALQSKMSDSASTTSSTTIASSTAVKTAKDAADAAQVTANAALPKAGGTMTGNVSFQNSGQGVVFSDSSSIFTISDSTSTTSNTTAASSTAVKSAYDLANGALARTGGIMTGAISFVAGQSFPVSGIQDATTGQKGVVQVGTNINVASGVISVASGSTSTAGILQLTDSTSSTSTTTAATPNSVKTSYDLANAALPKAGGTMTGSITFASGQTFPVSGIQNATTLQKGVVQIGTNISVTSGTISVATGSTTVAGILQLTDSTSSTSTTTAATPNSVKAAYDAATAAQTTANAALPKSAYTAKGDLVAGTAASTAVALPVGTNGQVLAANSACTTGLNWVTPCSGTVTSITAGTGLSGGTITTTGTISLNTACVVQPTAYTAKGTILGASAASTPAALAVGIDGQILVACSAATTGLCWVTSSAAAAIPTACITGKGALVTGTAANTPTALPVGTDGQVLTANSACATGLAWQTRSAASVLVGMGLALSSTATRYLAFIGTSSTATESTISQPLPVAGTLKNLYIKLSSNAGTTGNGYTFTVFKNGVATSIVVTITGTATTGSDLVNTTTFVAGDTISIRAVPSASGATNSINLTWSAEYDTTLL